MFEEATIAALERHQRTLPDELYEQALKDQHVRAWSAASKFTIVCIKNKQRGLARHLLVPPSLRERNIIEKN